MGRPDRRSPDELAERSLPCGRRHDGCGKRLTIARFLKDAGWLQPAKQYVEQLKQQFPGGLPKESSDQADALLKEIDQSLAEAVVQEAEVAIGAGRYDAAGQLLAAWAERYVDVKPDEIPATPAGRVLVRETREGKFTNQIIVGRHVIRADEPVAAGGLDTGLSPYDLLCAALGACTAITLRLYADMKGIPLERVTVELKHEKIHATDCAECETKEGKIDRIERLIGLEGTLDPAQRQKLLEIANKCPVHRTLHSEVVIPTRLSG